MGRTNGQSPEYEKKKAAIWSVMSFNDANDIKYSRLRLFKHFGVSAMTGYSWFPIPERTGPQRGRPKTVKAKNETDSPRPKRARSEGPDGLEDDVDDLSAFKSEFDHSPIPPRSNPDPDRNDGRQRKRSKAAMNDDDDDDDEKNGPRSSAVTPPPPGPISPPSTVDTSSPSSRRKSQAPPKRARGRPRKYPASGSKGRPEMVRDVKHELVDGGGGGDGDLGDGYEDIFDQV